MSTIVSTLQRIVRHELRGLRFCELGVVEAVYPHGSSGDDENYGCDVALKNSELKLERVPIATGHIGTVAVPNVGDLVLLAFDKGDVNQPLVIGRLYNDGDRAPVNQPDQVLFRLPLAEADDRSVLASIRNWSDESPPREISVQMPPKITLRISDGRVTATAGRTEMELDQETDGGGRVTIFAGGTQITLDQDGDVTIDAAGSMQLRAAGDLSLQAQNVSVEASLAAKVNAGTEAKLAGGVTAAVEGGASTRVSGATVSVRGVASFSP